MSAAQFVSRYYSEVVLQPDGGTKFLNDVPKPHPIVVGAGVLLEAVEMLRRDSHWNDARYHIVSDTSGFDQSLIGKLCVQVCTKPLHPKEIGQWTHPQEVEEFFREIGVPMTYEVIRIRVDAVMIFEQTQREAFLAKGGNILALPSCVPTTAEVNHAIEITGEDPFKVMMKLQDMIGALVDRTPHHMF
jgi:hypothetical protein